MGILDRILRRKKKVSVGEEVRYILKKQGPGGGMVKVSELTEPQPIEDLYQNLVPGMYSLHKYKKGQTGFEVVWGPVEVLGEEAPKEGAAAVRRSPFAGLREWANEMKEAKEDLAGAFEVLGPMAGYTKAGEGKQKTVVEQLQEAKAQKVVLDDLFPGSTTKSEDVPIEGKIPAWLVYAPQVVDKSMDSIEKRLTRWGLIEEQGVGSGGEKEFIRLPEKPKAAKERKESVAETEAVEEGGVIKLPEKPVAKTEVREVDVKEEKEKKGEEKSGGEGSKRAK